MYSEQKPLFTLNIGEFMALVKQQVERGLQETQNKNPKLESEKDEHFNIKQLAEFLKCSKVSVHNYKHKGMPFYRIGRKILFKKSEVLNFMKTLKGKNVII